MPDLGEVFKDRESVVSAARRPLDEGAMRSVADTIRRLRRRDTAVRSGTTVVTVAALVFSGMLAFSAIASDDPIAPRPAPTVSDPEELTPTHSPEPVRAEPALIDGFAPVPHLPADAIPWEEVGAGWFALSYYEERTWRFVDIEDGSALPPDSGGISLISPNGTWYAARSLEEMGSGVPLFWDGDAMYLASRGSRHSMEYDVTVVDLRSGQVMGEDHDIVWESAFGIGPGQAMVFGWGGMGGGGLHNTVAGVDLAGVGGCGDAGSGFWGWEADDMSFLYSPERGGRMVCFGPSANSSSRTAVTLVNVADVSQSRVINEFQFEPRRYSFAGWLDSDRFYFARTSETLGRTQTDVMFTYDLRDNSIETVDLPMYDDRDDFVAQVYFDGEAQRHVAKLSIGGVWTVHLYEPDGAHVASIEGTCADPEGNLGLGDVQTTGERLLVSCRESGAMQLIDTATGASLGQWNVGSSRFAIDGHRPE